MNNIPPKLRQELSQDREYQQCARKCDGDCDGRITWEHAIIYAGKQVQARWAIIPLCEYHHAVNKHQDGPGLDKKKNQWIAFNRATDEELDQYPKASPHYKQQREYLNTIYGTYRSTNTKSNP